MAGSTPVTLRHSIFDQATMLGWSFSSVEHGARRHHNWPDDDQPQRLSCLDAGARDANDGRVDRDIRLQGIAVTLFFVAKQTS